MRVDSGHGWGISRFSGVFPVWLGSFSVTMEPVTWLCNDIAWLIHIAFLLVATKWALAGSVLMMIDGSLLTVALGSSLANLSWLTRPFLIRWLSELWLLTFPSLLASGVLFAVSWREGRKMTSNMLAIFLMNILIHFKVCSVITAVRMARAAEQAV
ncbi:MAG: hypothetical protein HYX83_04565 [Chloroflexi bacterium]|nr:hypothetical protein [Chloroflexota bacterium]